MNDSSPVLTDSHKSNNFDFLRLIGAFMVLFSHCFPIAAIPGVRDPLARITINDEMSFGKLGVIVFFLISGYLISQSYENSSGLISYCKARVLRIFPGLLVVLLLSAYVMGPLMTRLPLSDYFAHSDVHKYVRTVFLFPTYYELPGIFLENRYKGIVNGSLWSISYEFLCYILVACLGLLRLNGSRFIALVLIVFALLVDCSFSAVFGANAPAFGQLSLQGVIHTCYPFFCGMLFYSFRSVIVYRPVYAAVCFLVLCFGSFYGGMYYACCICGGYLLFYYAFHGPRLTHGIAKFGDFSYGGYLYSFPIQQCVVDLNGGTMGPYLQLLITTPLTLVCAWFSWHCVEKRALRLKKVRLLGGSFLGGAFSALAKSAAGMLDTCYSYLAKRALYAAVIIGGGLSVAYGLYTFPPTCIQFPYEGSTRVLTGGWLPQTTEGPFRWVSGSATAQLYTEKRHFTLCITGYLPPKFTDVREMRVLINGNELKCYPLSGGDVINIELPVDMGVPDQKFTATIAFNDYHHFQAGEPEERKLSALINKICVR